MSKDCTVEEITTALTGSSPKYVQVRVTLPLEVEVEVKKDLLGSTFW